MRKLFFLLILCCMAAVQSVCARTYVLVVGVSNYNDDRNNLTQTTKDAKRFKDLMSKQTRDISILTSSYANHDNILKKLREIANHTKEGDRLIFFYSGHGTDNALYCYDGRLYYREIVEVLSSAKSKEKICFVDACLSGTVEKALISDGKMKYPDISFLVSSRDVEYSSEHPAVGAGFFTQALIEGMRGKGDANRDKQVTLEELFKFVYYDVVKRSLQEQHPQLYAASAMRSIVMYTNK